MRTIFVDANVIIDWLNADSHDNDICTRVIQTIVGLYRKPMVSNTSIAITFYAVSKHLKDKKKVKELMLSAFSLFNVSIEDEWVTQQALNSDFTDLEDAIQYYSAIKSKADAIVTFNGFDFVGAKIPVLHPAEFLQLHTIS